MGRGAGSAETDPRVPGQGSLKSPAFRIILVICTILVLYVVLLQLWRAALPRQTAFLSAGELKKLYLAEGVLVRDETVITAPAGGQLNMLVQEGEKVRAGESIAEVKTVAGDTARSNRTVLIRAPRSGVVICRTDGLEGVLNPGHVDILEVAGVKLRAGEGPGRDEGKGGRCDKGQPVLKIVDNLSPVVICLQVPDGFPPGLLKKGGTISMTWENSEFAGRITDARDYRGRPQLVVEVMSYPAGFLQQRKVILGLEGGTVTGCLVPAKSLVEKDGQAGLYIMDKHRVRWVPVSLEGVVDDTAAVSGAEVVPGTRYVVNPRRLFNRV